MKNGIIFLFILFIIAKVTVPDRSKLKPYLIKKGKAEGICNPLIGSSYTNYFLFSIEKVRYCENLPAPVTVADTGKDTINGLTKLNRIKPVPLIRKTLRTDTYLGLFGTYWKIN